MKDRCDEIESHPVVAHMSVSMAHEGNQGSGMPSEGLDWIRLNCMASKVRAVASLSRIGLDWIGLDWIGMASEVRAVASLRRIGLNGIGLDWH
eukprot:6486941-Amphidinium_carterae.1